MKKTNTHFQWLEKITIPTNSIESYFIIWPTLELEVAFKAKNEGTTTVSEWLEAMRRNFESRYELFESILEIANLSENNDKTFLFKTLQAIPDILTFYDEQLRLLEEKRNNAKTTLEETQIRSQYHLIKARQESNIKNFAINQVLETELRRTQAQKQYEKARYDLEVVHPIEVKIKEQELKFIKARV